MPNTLSILGQGVFRIFLGLIVFSLHGYTLLCLVQHGKRSVTSWPLLSSLHGQLLSILPCPYRNMNWITWRVPNTLILERSLHPYHNDDKSCKSRARDSPPNLDTQNQTPRARNQRV